MEELGFIILRHVNNELTDKYWIHCYESIRKFYPENLILIVDDNSNYDYITEHTLYKTTVINSEFPKRGELLPYYYYLKNPLFKKAVVIHDSAFINSIIDTDTDKYKFIWEFEHYWDQPYNESEMMLSFNDPELMYFYNNKNLWKGCFGCMAIITYDFLNKVNERHNLSKLIDFVLSRYNRQSLERVLACIFQFNGSRQTLLGNIHTYCKWGITFEDKDSINHLPIIKVWTGR